ncbi:hypothetical protein [Methylobacterium sp. J-090]|uniref:hypothetical protein n=1 Tax=Methylobacterium sp. J-090 TaxID=2836666 RepID=UPI001FB96DFC|nr:hypothetical protein [Methylobacterium sp. J-090]MCJ2083144.1 hypothetical protein [Methylobacterium sp. J-090]
MNPATAACSALLALSALTFAPGSLAQTAPPPPQARPAQPTPSPATQRQTNPGQTNPGQGSQNQGNPNQATTPQPAPAPRQANPGPSAPTQVAPAPGGRGAGAGRRPRSSYASCNRQAHARGLRGGARRRFLIRCKLGYERPRQPQVAPARQP